MNNFKELKVWKKSIDLVKLIYEITQQFPKEETYGLTNQVRRCAVSIPSNIAEGAGRKGNKEFEQFLHISLGSSFELETQLIIANKLSYIKPENLFIIENQLHEIQKMIRGLQKSLK